MFPSGSEILGAMPPHEATPWTMPRFPLYGSTVEEAEGEEGQTGQIEAFMEYSFNVGFVGPVKKMARVTTLRPCNYDLPLRERSDSVAYLGQSKLLIYPHSKLISNQILMTALSSYLVTH